MFRRCVILLLVALLLANQAICLAHAHAGMNPSELVEHAQRAHYHHGGHGHGDSAHEHDDHAPVARASTDGVSQRMAISPTLDHDSDAVYLAGPTTLIRGKSTSGVEVVKAFQDVVPLLLTDRRHAPPQARPQSPAVFSEPCSIYLRTLSLRI
jgi:hypothetical protein